MNNQKFYSLILAAATVVAGASAASVQPMQKLMGQQNAAAGQTMRLTPAQRHQQATQAKANNLQKPHRLVSQRAIGTADGLEIVTEVPQPDNLKLGVKAGAYYSYNWLFGMSFSDMSTNLSQYEIVDGKFYMNFPFCSMETNGYLVGDVKDNTITINFPQWVNHYEDYNYLGEPYSIDDYALLCEFVPNEDDPEVGTYAPSETQTLTFTINKDGVIENAAWEDFMIGACEWVKEVYDEETDEYVPVENPYWSWTGTGDFISSITEFNGTAVEMPAGLAAEEWSMIDGVSGRKVSVAIDGNDMYLQGLFTRNGFNPVIKGKIEGDKVTFETGQYVGAYLGNMTLVYFQGVHVGFNEDGDLASADLLPALVFSYDKDKKDLRAEEAAFFSSMKDEVRWYTYYIAPHIFVPDASLTGRQLLDPVVVDFYPVEDGYSGEIVFDFPNVDAAGNMLDTSKLSYNVFVDGEVFECYPDEYPKDVNEDDIMVNIPYDHDGYDIYYSGVEHYFYFYVEGFDTMAIQTRYVDGDFESKSNLVYVYGGSGIKDIIAGNEKNVEYFDLQGRRVNKNANGILLRRATMQDGSSVTTKFIKH